jgi:hypothetical protein
MRKHLITNVIVCGVCGAYSYVSINNSIELRNLEAKQSLKDSTESRESVEFKS